MLATQAEIIAIAFPRSISTSKISNSLVEATQYKYIRPVLEEDLYDALVAAPTDPAFSGILQLVKNALAWWVKYKALPEIFVEISDTGAHLMNANNAQTVADQRFIEVRAEVADVAEQHTQILADYLEDHPITGYAPGTAQEDISMAGGILVYKDGEASSGWPEEEDGSKNWKTNY